MSEVTHLIRVRDESMSWKWSDRDGTVTYDINFADIPDSVILEAAKRGLAHVLSNEAASKAVAAMDKMEYIADRDATRAELLAQAREAYIQSFYDGSWGTRRGPSGPRVDAVETEFMRILLRETRAYLTKHSKIKYDKDTKVWYWMAGGERVNRTLEEAAENFRKGSTADGTPRETAYMEQARSVVEAKRAAAAAAKAKGQVEVDDDDLEV